MAGWMPSERVGLHSRVSTGGGKYGILLRCAFFFYQELNLLGLFDPKVLFREVLPIVRMAHPHNDHWRPDLFFYILYIFNANIFNFNHKEIIFSYI